MQPVEKESFSHEALRNLVGMLFVVPIFAVPLLAALAIPAVLAGRIERVWIQGIASAAVLIVVPLSMTAAFRIARRFGDRWPFS